MNIQGITASNDANSVVGASPIAGSQFDSQLQGAMGDVASLLGMSGQQLMANLAQSGSLSAVAQSAGVSQQQLVSTIEKGLQDSGSNLTGTQLENVANRIASHRGHGHHHHHHAPATNGSSTSDPFSALLASAAASLGTSAI